MAVEKLKSALSPLDTALVLIQEDKTDNQELDADYYELFLNTMLYIPTWDVPENGEVQLEELNEDLSVQPIIVEDDGKTYIMLFDDQDELAKWAGEREVGVVGLTGHDILQLFGAENHMMLNATSEHLRVFSPQEIEWLLANITDETD